MVRKGKPSLALGIPNACPLPFQREIPLAKMPT